MDIHEYQAKEILKSFGVTVPEGANHLQIRKALCVSGHGAKLLRKEPIILTRCVLPHVAAVARSFALVLLILFLILPPAALWMSLGMAVVGGLVYAYFQMRRILKELAQPPVFTEAAQTPEQVDKAPKSPDFRITEPGDSFRPKTRASDSVEAVRFKTALKEMYAVDVAARKAAFVPAKRKLDLPLLVNEVVNTLHPDKTIPRLVLDRILLPDRIRFVPEKFDQIMEYPKFDQPMYKPLVDLSDEYFLPNINLIPQNSITLLETNQKFIESYMVGINHEMSRELLWREYPTDQRGSYFRQFWDVSQYRPEKDEDLDDLKEKLKDIPELHKWKLNT